MNRTNIISILAVLLLLAASIETSAQRRNKAPQTRFGLKFGLNMSDLTSARGLDIYNGLAYFDENKNYVGFTDTKPWKMGFNAGVTMQSAFDDTWYLQTSLLFTTKGYKLNTQDVEITCNASYIQLPVDLVYKYEIYNSFKFLAQAGAFVGVGAYGYTDFFDHYGENELPRRIHEQSPDPNIANGYIGFDPTVHGSTFWKDSDDTFETDGTYRMDAGVSLGIGFEFSKFQLMLNYQYSLTPLYNYDHDFSGRYEQKGMDQKTSFEYFNLETPSSPHQHMVSLTLSYYFDAFKNKLKW
ncbi:MAG: hypothetical protein H6Q15_1104 [Bacteroidetes bacterium]|nr:hypothetical protein [Bacteroidota bacterium]